MRTLLLIGFLAAAAHPARAQLTPAQHAAIDSVFAALDGQAGPGCAVGVVRNGELVHARGHGLGNLDHGIPLGPSSVFYLASVSKQFAAAAVLIAEHEGFLSLDDDVRMHIPELPDYGDALTIRHLLHHTSGLRDYLTLMLLAGLPPENVFTDKAMLDLIARQRALNFTPGTEFLYSNTGYVLLAEIVKRATGRSLRTYADEKIFRPLGMANTHFHDDAGQVVPGRVFSYVRSPDGDWRMSYLMNFDRVGDGGLYSSVEDLARWDAAFYTDVLDIPGFADRMYTRGVLASGDTIPYARGLSHDRRGGLQRITHGGALMGFLTLIVRYPERRASVITLCNGGAANPATLSDAVEDIVLAGEWSEPVASPGASAGSGATEDATATLDVAPAAATALAGAYISAELESTWVIDAAPNGVVLRHPSGNSFPLVTRDGSVFRSANGLELRFLRQDSAVTGFVLSIGRVRNMAFERVR